MKRCTKCGHQKPISEFYRNKTCKDGLQTQCRQCMRDYQKTRTKTQEEKDKAAEHARRFYYQNKAKIKKHRAAYRLTPKGKRAEFRRWLKTQYGLSLEKYLEMQRLQLGKCAICGVQDKDSKPHGILSVDHNHDTKQVRALICHHCNSALGFVNEDIAVLKAMIEYIQKHNI